MLKGAMTSPANNGAAMTHAAAMSRAQSRTATPRSTTGSGHQSPDRTSLSAGGAAPGLVQVRAATAAAVRSASLTIAGAYVDTGLPVPPDCPAPVHDVLHLFGATANDPPTYYYRTCQNLIASRDGTTAASWSAWQKVTVQITSRNVSPVVYQGRLQVFWIDITTKPQNQIASGASTFVGYRHQMSLSFTTYRPDGTWTAPQKVTLPVDPTSSTGSPPRATSPG